MNSNHLGPKLGELVKGHERDFDFFEACTKKNFEIEKHQEDSGIPYETLWKNRKTIYAKLQKAMSCNKCHNGRYKGPIKLPFDSRFTFMKISAGEMPPGNTLSEFERILLANCLSAEMIGIWGNKEVPGTVVRFLTATSCGKANTSTAAPTPSKEVSH